MALRLTDTERANIRAALLAMGPERRARLEGQCFAGRHEGDTTYYVNPECCCVVGKAIKEDLPDKFKGEWIPIPHYAAHRLGFDAETPEYEGVLLMSNLNDAGKLRTRAAVAELLALAE